MKKLFLMLLATAIAVPAFVFVGAPNADAACSINGLINSGGKCAASYKISPRKNVDIRFDRSPLFDNDRYERILELLRLIRELQAILAGRDFDDDDSDDFNITTLTVINTKDNRTTLRGEVDFGASDFVDVWFEWGEDDDDLDERTGKERIDDDEDEHFEETITGLEPGTRYYYRAVGEDEDGDRDRGLIRSFVTDGDNRDKEPDVVTLSARSVTDDSADLRGSVDMNDFRNGKVFFVYGEDEDLIEDVESDFDTYSEVDEDGEDLQKVLVDRDLDDDESYRQEVDGLDSGTEHFFSICVEYDDDGDPTILCGRVESFTTDRN